jgi:hypothetical protein
MDITVRSGWTSIRSGIDRKISGTAWNQYEQACRGFLRNKEKMLTKALAQMVRRIVVEITIMIRRIALAILDLLQDIKAKSKRKGAD